MSEKISLPDGAWAVLRDPEMVTERQRRPLVQLQRKVLGSDVGGVLVGAQGTDLSPAETLQLLRPVMASDDFNMIEQIDDLLMVVLIDSWSYEQPVTVDATLDLPRPARSALLAACKPLLGKLLGDTSDEDVLDPASPTVPANGSDKP